MIQVFWGSPNSDVDGSRLAYNNLKLNRKGILSKKVFVD